MVKYFVKSDKAIALRGGIVNLKAGEEISNQLIINNYPNLLFTIEEVDAPVEVIEPVVEVIPEPIIETPEVTDSIEEVVVEEVTEADAPKRGRKPKSN